MKFAGLFIYEKACNMCNYIEHLAGSMVLTADLTGDNEKSMIAIAKTAEEQYETIHS